MIEKQRISQLNNQTIKERPYVIYWMQNAQRVDYNHALEYAIIKANSLNKKLIIYFGLTYEYEQANQRHYYFMLEGLQEVNQQLQKKSIKMIIQNISPDKGIINISEQAALVVVDKGYLKIEKKWRKHVANNIDVPLVEVETNLIVPIEEVSNKEEYGAYTIRNKINKLIDFYAKAITTEELINKSINDDLKIKELNINNIDEIVKSIDNSVKKTNYFKGGITEARKKLDDFINNKLEKYDILKNNPELDYQSNLSPYLHFGQISSLEIYIKIKEKNNKESFLEELIIRRELAYNFVYYNQNYDKYESLPNWALKTLEEHQEDKREYIYKVKQLETATTHDQYWNTCQKEMIITGKMHGYMRMYWGKKVIEWSSTPKEAFVILLYLNNKYNLDGRDPNSYAGIAWCFGKHDRPWKKRPVFGMIRYMNNEGLKRKFNIDDYVKKINSYEK